MGKTTTINVRIGAAHAAVLDAIAAAEHDEGRVASRTAALAKVLELERTSPRLPRIDRVMALDRALVGDFWRYGSRDDAAPWHAQAAPTAADLPRRWVVEDTPPSAEAVPDSPTPREAFRVASFRSGLATTAAFVDRVAHALQLEGLLVDRDMVAVLLALARLGLTPEEQCRVFDHCGSPAWEATAPPWIDEQPKAVQKKVHRARSGSSAAEGGEDRG